MLKIFQDIPPNASRKGMDNILLNAPNFKKNFDIYIIK